MALACPNAVGSPPPDPVSTRWSRRNEWDNIPFFGTHAIRPTARIGCAPSGSKMEGVRTRRATAQLFGERLFAPFFYVTLFTMDWLLFDFLRAWGNRSHSLYGLSLD